MITQRRLRHLLSLVEHAHFGRAAEALNISQPALTKSIQALESELGVTLLDRKRGALGLTVFGELVARRSRALLDGEADMLHEIKLLARRPKIRIAARVASWREVARDDEAAQTACAPENGKQCDREGLPA